MCNRKESWRQSGTQSLEGKKGNTERTTNHFWSSDQAGEFGDTFILRAYDAVQLAAAHRAMAVAQEPLVFACFDARLNQVSRVLGMEARFAL
jgi:hypothetical protein